MTDKIQTAIRIKKDLWEWVKGFCATRGLTVTGFLTGIIVDKRDKEEAKTRQK